MNNQHDDPGDRDTRERGAVRDHGPESGVETVNWEEMTSFFIRRAGREPVGIQ